MTLWTNALARRLHVDSCGRKIEAVEVERNGHVVRVEAPVVIVSCGAVNSAALLLRSTRETSGRTGEFIRIVGRRYMAHLATMMQGSTRFDRTTRCSRKPWG